MSDLTETCVREIVRDELSVLQVPELLAVIETKLDQKADKTDVESLKNQIASLKEEERSHFKFIVGFFIAMFLLLIAIAVRK